MSQEEISKHQVIEAFEKRDVSMQEFCNQYKISKSTLYKWRQELKPDIGDSREFIPISIVESDNGKAPAVEEVKMANIGSSFKISKFDLSIEFISGCNSQDVTAKIKGATKLHEKGATMR